MTGKMGSGNVADRIRRGLEETVAHAEGGGGQAALWRAYSGGYRCEGDPGEAGYDAGGVCRVLWVQYQYVAALGAGPAGARGADAGVSTGDRPRSEGGSEGTAGGVADGAAFWGAGLTVVVRVERHGFRDVGCTYLL